MSRLGTILVLGAAIAGCRHPVILGEGRVPLVVTSSAFLNGAAIPRIYTCDGPNHAPPLSWSAPPRGTGSLVLMVIDRDPILGTFLHWTVYDIPPGVGQLPAGITAANLPPGAQQGLTDFDSIGYGGPCPPSGDHRYAFEVYAVDSSVSLPPRATRHDFERSLPDHILAHGELIGRYHR